MATIVLIALLISAIIYLVIGFSLGKHNKSLADLFPIIFGRNAKVQTIDEFSTSTIATTVSLATIVLAYFELAGSFGLWLLWTAVTTTFGMYIVSLTSKRIWRKMSTYTHRPSMHEFLGIEFNSKSVALIASACTSIGFLLIFATELVVGSKFLAGLVPFIPQWVTVVFLSAVGFTYTLYGGFRAVIKTDQIQMKFIWALIIAFAGYYAYYIFSTGGWAAHIQKVPPGILSLSSRPGLGFFLLGIAIMNIPTHISNMAVWQRISGVQNPEIIEKGIKRSVYGIGMAWGMLSLIACFGYMVVVPGKDHSLIIELLKVISLTPGGKIVLFVVTLGLYGAMLSTASTNLIVVSHTLSEDIFAKLRKKILFDRIESHKELNLSKGVLIGSTLLAIFLVEGLKLFGFSIADLVFAIYGGSLALFPLIITALYNKPERLKTLSGYANAAVIAGFVGGWGAALTGKITGDSNLIFLSPSVSIFTSGLIIIVGLAATTRTS